MTERPEDVTPDETQADPGDPDLTLEPESGADATAEPAVEPEPEPEPIAEAEPEPAPAHEPESGPDPEPGPVAGAEPIADAEPEPAADAAVEPEPEPEPPGGSRDLLHTDDPPTDVISPVPPTATAGPNLAWVAERSSFAARARSWATEVVDPLVPAGLPFVPDGSPFVPPVPTGPQLAEPPVRRSCLRHLPVPTRTSPRRQSRTLPPRRCTPSDLPRLRTPHPRWCRHRPVSYTHLTLPT